jgi:Sec-independent protein secretion pathway component TatC
MNKTALLIRLGIAMLWAFTPMVLAAFKLLDYQRLKSFRPYMIVANLIIAAVLTTPEVLTQVLAAAALQASYEAGVLISYIREWPKRKRPAMDV